VPLAEHVSVSVPQWPQATGSVCPGAHVPTQAPLTHVWLVHGTGVPHCPPPLHVWTPLPEHCFWVGVQEPVQTPPTHVPLAQGPGAPYWPQPPHVSRSAPEHDAEPGVQAGADAHEQAPQVQVAVQVWVP
jgi:hypothetical protein